MFLHHDGNNRYRRGSLGVLGTDLLLRRRAVCTDWTGFRSRISSVESHRRLGLASALILTGCMSEAGRVQ
jgi:hypothetical protein